MSYILVALSSSYLHDERIHYNSMGPPLCPTAELILQSAAMDLKVHGVCIPWLKKYLSNILSMNSRIFFLDSFVLAILRRSDSTFFCEGSEKYYLAFSRQSW